MIQLIAGGKDITQAVKPSISLEDDFTYGSVKLSFEFKHVTELFTVRPGMFIQLYINKKKWFEGFTIDWGRSFSHDGRITAHDPFFYLVKSSYDFAWRNKTADQISKELFSRYGIKVKDIVKSSHVFKQLLCRGQDYESIFTILITVWSETRKRTGKKYWLRYEEGARIFERKPPSKVPVLTALENSEYSESIEEMVNEFRIVDREKNIVVTKRNATSVKNYGLISKVEDYTAINKADATRYAAQQVKVNSRIKSKYSANAVLPIEAERLWTGDYVYIPDSNGKTLHGKYIRKLNISFFGQYMQLALELDHAVELPTMEIKVEEKVKK